MEIEIKQDIGEEIIRKLTELNEMLDERLSNRGENGETQKKNDQIHLSVKTSFKNELKAIAYF